MFCLVVREYRQGGGWRAKVALHLKSLAWHGLACRDTFEGWSTWAALLSWLIGSKWARSHGAVNDRGRCSHAVGSVGWGAVWRWRATRLDGHFGKTGAWDNTLLAAIHLCAECLGMMLVCVRKRYVSNDLLTHPSSYS